MKKEETTLDKIRTRPRFKLIIQLSQDEYAAGLKKYLQEHREQFSGNVNSEMVTVSVKTETDSYWKPYLSLRIEKEEENTVIRGVFGPSSAVWTFFMFLYFLFGILWMVFITMWFVEKQIKSNEFPWALSASITMLVLIFLTYAAAKIGQRRSNTEMEMLRNFAEESVLPFES
ncbi:hypothetical protein [Chryseobacterium sp.]|uniref:hypothetical protein n=1 Tax=Chryseobacterium sp. TaxID=1871047 RepID=UPI0011CC7796|nr:hypothetical protein [Chryseobacterium sp.]TXF74987.1 hypothetical protein FUA25_11940 [Chryseobacterium sp.]